MSRWTPGRFLKVGAILMAIWICLADCVDSQPSNRVENLVIALRRSLLVVGRSAQNASKQITVTCGWHSPQVPVARPVGSGPRYRYTCPVCRRWVEF